ncbi:MAG: hypothetical protein ACFB02_07905 [Mastigocoleus sp.]
MNYELQTLYKTHQAFNCDVIASDEDRNMGRLYILTTDDTNLKELGIKQEWFLAYEEIDILISGHINKDDEWSLSPFCKLEPSFEYTTCNQIFEQVFNLNFISDLTNLCNKNINSLSHNINSSNSFNDNEDDDDSNRINKNNQIFMARDLIITTENLDVLKNIIANSNLEELVDIEQESDTEILDVSHHEQQLTTDESSVNDVVNYFSRKSAPPLEDDELFHIQINLTQRIMDEYFKQDKDEFVLSPLGVVTINNEEGCCSLKDLEDGHIIFTATFDSDVIHGLNNTDALKVDIILDYLDKEEVRREKYMKKEEDLITEVNTPQINQKPEIEYDS